jgi:hypothetical protein
LVKRISLPATSIDTRLPLSLIMRISNAPVLNSAAMACTAKYIDWNGFWLIQRCRTRVTHSSAEMLCTRTPHQNADGSRKNMKKWMLRGVNCMALQRDAISVRSIVKRLALVPTCTV